ncbi:MAG TPA: tetratricopeptide repeat protein [Pyrinomonadaceae bacterium]|nr:tetratricopeptide repeat protein [Pyrinomonadaceae bacterium]
MEQKLTQTDTRLAGLSEHVIDLCREAKRLEETGKYEDARSVLQEFWQRVGDRPRLEGLDTPAQAELILRVGTVSGWLGSARQIQGAQEAAKDLLSESATLFESLNLPERVAEAHVDLGICYWREGALDEARITFDVALQKLGNLQSQQRLRALLNKALVEEVSSRTEEALEILSTAAPLFEDCTNHVLKGRFHTEFGTALKNAGLAQRREDYIDRSLMHYTAAIVELEQAGEVPGLSVTENNIAFLYTKLGRFTDAHEHLDRAISLNVQGDKGLHAQFEDTRAQVFMAQRLFDKAERAAASAVRSFREGDEQKHLALALTTQGTLFARLGRKADALASFNEAIAVAERVGDRETGGLASITIIEELSETLSRQELLAHLQSAESALNKLQNLAVQIRLGECARKLLAEEASIASSGTETSPNFLTGEGTLEDQVLRYEAELIKRALDVSGGSVTRAARLLGVTHQGLAFILNGRQKNLLSSRKPAKPRRRSIIRFH